MNTKWLIFILFFAIMSVQFFSKGLSMNIPNVTVNLKLNQTDFKVGGDLILQIEIKNNSYHKIRILPWMGPYEHGWIRIFDYRNNLEMRKDVKIIFELDPSFPYRDSYVLLPSYGIHIVTLRGKISKDEKGVLYVDFKKASLYGSLFCFIEDYASCIDALYNDR